MYKQKKKLCLCPDKNGQSVGIALLWTGSLAMVRLGPAWSNCLCPGQPCRCTPRRNMPCPFLFPALLPCQCLLGYFPCQWFRREIILRVRGLDGAWKHFCSGLLCVSVLVCDSWWWCDWTKQFTGDVSVAAVGKERGCPGFSVNTGSQARFPFLQCFLLRPKRAVLEWQDFPETGESWAWSFPCLTEIQPRSTHGKWVPEEQSKPCLLSRHSCGSLD